MPGAKRQSKPALWSDLTIHEQQNPNPSRLERGRAAERAVAAFLASQGYTLLTANYSVAQLGELDLVMCRASNHDAEGDMSRKTVQAGRQEQTDMTLAVVEVKARRDSLHFGGPAAALTPAKLRRVRLTTLHFQQKHHYMNNSVELLAALVQLDNLGNVQHIEITPIEWQ